MPQLLLKSTSRRQYYESKYNRITSISMLNYPNKTLSTPWQESQARKSSAQPVKFQCVAYGHASGRVITSPRKIVRVISSASIAAVTVAFPPSTSLLLVAGPPGSGGSMGIFGFPLPGQTLYH